MSRNAHDICLLCNQRLATKTNSHIASKFLGKSILGEDGPKKAYVLDSTKPHLPPKISQDSPKEDYLFCPDCERYFSTLETYVAEHFFKRILNNKYNEYFTYGSNPHGVEYGICNELDTRIFRLFIISLYWRCSVATEAPFNYFKITNEDELRGLLMESFTTDVKQFSGTANEALYKFPIVVIRPKGEVDKTKNVLYPNKANEDISQLILNEYCFMLAQNNNTGLKEMGFINNEGNQPFIIGFLSNDSWEELIGGLLKRAAEASKLTAMRLGVIPHSLTTHPKPPSHKE